MKTKLTLVLITLAGLLVLGVQIRGKNSKAAALDDLTNADYKGGSHFDFVSAGPKRGRVGAIPDTSNCNLVVQASTRKAATIPQSSPPAPTPPPISSSI